MIYMIGRLLFVLIVSGSISYAIKPFIEVTKVKYANGRYAIEINKKIQISGIKLKGKALIFPRSYSKKKKRSYNIVYIKSKEDYMKVKKAIIHKNTTSNSYDKVIITDIKLRRVKSKKNSRFWGFASITFNDRLIVNSFPVFTTPSLKIKIGFPKVKRYVVVYLVRSLKRLIEEKIQNKIKEEDNELNIGD